MKRWAVVGTAIALAGCAHVPQGGGQATDLSALLAFAQPARCEPGEAHARLLGTMVAGDANVGFQAGRIDAASPYARSFAQVYLHPHEGYTVIGVPVQGLLFGLPLVAIEQSLPDGGDPGETHYRFRADPARVQSALTGQGFPPNMQRIVIVGPPDGYEHFIELTADPRIPGHTLLTCGYR